MKLVTFAGPPSSGKTSVILKVIECLREEKKMAGVVKFDCLTSFDQYRYKENDIPVRIGFSGKICPDHFFVCNIEDAVDWGMENQMDYLFTESAGLCNRCSPYIKGVLAVCVIDNLAGINTPKKIGPMLKFADIVVVTKGDIVSQAEREVFAYNIQTVNPGAKVIFVNGITGQGAYLLSRHIMEAMELTSVRGKKLRFTTPAAICAYCTGETKIGAAHSFGMIQRMDFSKEIQDEPEEMQQLITILPQKPPVKVEVRSLTIQGGQNKYQEPEEMMLSMRPGEIISIVGPTGSGKSRLLEDIECLAQGDTPTKRKIFLNGEPVSDDIRYEIGGSLVAQLSQNMNFVMDMTVGEFLTMHAKCRMSYNIPETVQQCFEAANELAGERFVKETKITQLSGGQSRALMIADTAFMSASPIVLIDEIENAGINRREAITLLAKEEKIVFLSTHDPLLALNADRRIVIKNGGMHKVLTTTDREKKDLEHIEELDAVLQNVREQLRGGKEIVCGNYMMH
ncbi:MAG: ATP-binding cassette domain-containing protein [Lachnospiraceae bacterium]